MNVCIHRGTKQIGSTCIELEHGGARLLLDVGLPLDAAEASPDLLPKVEGVQTSDDRLVAVALSHPHQDHYGFKRFLPPRSPARAAISPLVWPFLSRPFAGIDNYQRRSR
jgi:ribonuclease J